MSGESETTVLSAAHSALSGAATGISGVFGALVGTASCASCLASVFGLMGVGVGSALFVLSYQMYFLLGAIVLMSVSLYVTARKINNTCVSC